MHIEGIVVACVTPWKRSNQIDEAALWRHLEMQLSAGVQGLCVAGSTGEFPRMEAAEYSRLVRATVEIDAGRTPVFAGIGHASLEGSLQLARLATEAGASALLAPPPFYFSYQQSEIIAFFDCLARQVALPLLLYNIPQFCSPIGPETAVSLLKKGSFLGIKESGGDPEMMEALLAARRDRPFTLLSGFDRTLGRAIQMSADGAVSGIAACAPEAMIDLYRAARSGNGAETARAQARVNELADRLDQFPAPVGIRLALEARGLPVGPHAIPLPRETEAAAREFALWFERWLAG